MNLEFECEAEPTTLHEIKEDGEELVTVPAIGMRYTHNGYQWIFVKMTPEEWLQAIAAVTEHIPKDKSCHVRGKADLEARGCSCEDAVDKESGT